MAARRHCIGVGRVPKSVSSPAYDQSASILLEAVANSEAYPCFWMRGLIPAPWTSVSPPPSSESWGGGGLFKRWPRRAFLLG
eukprot:5865402-Pyramimonas_sp.AAC.1